MSLCCDTSAAPPGTSVDRINVTINSTDGEFNTEVIQCQDQDQCIYLPMLACVKYAVTVVIIDDSQIGYESRCFLRNSTNSIITGPGECIQNLGSRNIINVGLTVM